MTHRETGYYIVYNGGPQETHVLHWPDDRRSIEHELSDIEAGPFWCKSDANRALDLANTIASRFKDDAR